MIGSKKTVRELEPKRNSGISRLIKCYVCNQHLPSQAQFDLHLKQHQSSLHSNHTPLLRNTQTSFNSKSSVAPLSKTQTQLRSTRTRPPSNPVPLSLNNEEKEPVQQAEQKEVQQALRESQLILDHIDFITQLPCEPSSPKKQEPSPPKEQAILEKTINGERQLHRFLQENRDNPQKLILQTEFQSRSFQNYQQQLELLRDLNGNSENSRLVDIRDSICRDVTRELEQQFGSRENKCKTKLNKKVEAEIVANTGEVRFCAECYSDIGAMSDCYCLDCGHCFHPQCWDGECCS